MPFCSDTKRRKQAKDVQQEGGSVCVARFRLPQRGRVAPSIQVHAKRKQPILKESFTFACLHWRKIISFRLIAG